MEFDSRSNGVAIAERSTKLEHDKALAAARGGISKKANARCSSVANPKVQFSVEVPISSGDATAIIEKVQSRRGGDVRKAPAPSIEKAAVPLGAAPRLSGVNEFVDRCPGVLVFGAFRCGCTGAVRR